MMKVKFRQEKFGNNYINRKTQLCDYPWMREG